MPQSQVANEPAAIQALLAKDGITFTPVNGNTLILAQKTNFAPRVGFSYQCCPSWFCVAASASFIRAMRTMASA